MFSSCDIGRVEVGSEKIGLPPQFHAIALRDNLRVFHDFVHFLGRHDLAQCKRLDAELHDLGESAHDAELV